MYEIVVAENSDVKDWNLVLEDNDYREHFFRWEWRQIIQRVFSHKPYFLILKENNKPISICPLFHVNSFLFGSALISSPYINGGGIVGGNAESQKFLLDFIEDLQKKLNCKYCELRFRENLLVNVDDLKMRTHKVSMKVPLFENPEKLFLTFPPKLRSQIRRPTKEGCSAKIVKGDQVTATLVNDFYQVFSQTMRDLGTPVYSKSLFIETLKTFGENATLGIVYHESMPVAGGITIKSGNSVEIPWAASLRSKSKFAPNMLLYWELLKNACVEKCLTFDFGRSTKDSGTYKFKAQWGAEPLQLNWYYVGSENDIPNINPQNKKFETLVAIWRKLPLPIANIIGPIITKSIP